MTERMATGFRIIKPLELLNWERLPIDQSVSLEAHLSCPACTATLSVTAVLQSDLDSTSIRIGTCPACGYTGYMDRPTADWMSHYYAKTWTHGAEKDIAVLRGKKPKASALTLALEHALGMIQDRTEPVVEIGAGYGTVLRWVREQGFSNVLGLESSEQRAGIASAASGAKIFAGDFESDGIQRELRNHYPIRLLYSFHVLEHTFNPSRIIDLAANLQDPGGLFVLGVPNFWSEPAMSRLLFLPHLHSFTASSLAKLFEHAGYEAINTSFSDSRNLTIIARKLTHPLQPRELDHSNYPRLVREKFTRELAFDALAPSGRQRYSWAKKDAKVSSITPYRWYSKYLGTKLNRRDMRSLLIEPFSVTNDLNDGPITMKFAEGLFLCTK